MAGGADDGKGGALRGACHRGTVGDRLMSECEPRESGSLVERDEFPQGRVCFARVLGYRIVCFFVEVLEWCIDRTTE